MRSNDLRTPCTGPLGPIQRAIDESYTDFMVGGRFVHDFNNRWLLNRPGNELLHRAWNP